MENKETGWGCRVGTFSKGTEACGPCLDGFDNVEKVAQ